MKNRYPPDAVRRPAAYRADVIALPTPAAFFGIKADLQSAQATGKMPLFGQG